MRIILPGIIGSLLLVTVLSCDVEPTESGEFDLPVLNPIPDRTVSINDSITIPLGVTGVENSSFRYIISQPVLGIDDTVNADSVIYSIADTGKYMFAVGVLDEKNYLCGIGKFTVTVIAIAPKIRGVRCTGIDRCFVGDTLRFTVAASDSDGMVKRYLWSFDGAVYDTTTDSVYLNMPATEKSGAKTLYVKVVDDDGLVSQRDSMMVTVRRPIPPMIERIPAGINCHVNGKNEFTVTASDSDGTVKRYLWSFDNSVFDSTSSNSYSKAFPAAGSKTLYVKVIDDDGLVSQPDSITFFVHVPIPPVIKHISCSDSSHVNESLRFTVSASDSDGSVRDYQWSFDNKFFETTGVSVYVKRLDRSGTRTLYVKVIDDEGFVSQTDSIKFVVLPVASIYRTLLDTSVTGNDSATITVPPTGFSGKIIAYLWSTDGVTYDTTSIPSYTVFFPEDSFGVESNLVKAYRTEGVFPENDTALRAVLLVKAIDEDGIVSKPAQILISTSIVVWDMDGNIYHVVRIGNQLWTVENWWSTKYSDGTSIPSLAGRWGCNEPTPGYCYYNNTANSDSIRKFGALYTWYVVAPDNPKRIAPEGWRVPDSTDWNALINFLIANGYNWDGATSGNKIAKSLAATTDWRISSNEGTIGFDLTKNNSTGFSALPGGLKNCDCGSSCRSFYDFSDAGIWWSKTRESAETAWCYYLEWESRSLNISNTDTFLGFSIRLVRDVR